MEQIKGFCPWKMCGYAWVEVCYRLTTFQPKGEGVVWASASQTNSYVDSWQWCMMPGAWNKIILWPQSICATSSVGKSFFHACQRNQSKEEQGKLWGSLFIQDELFPCVHSRLEWFSPKCMVSWYIKAYWRNQATLWPVPFVFET